MATQECPCGHLGDGRRTCSCTPQQLRSYVERLSGPLLDRLDIQVPVPALEFEVLAAPADGESSERVRGRVNAARALQNRRLRSADSGLHCNAQMGPREIREHCALDRDGLALLQAAVQRLGLSARGFDRLLKVARTVADLDAAERIQVRHLAEAVQYRGLDRIHA
jgi:magnesium chelatase family protein